MVRTMKAVFENGVFRPLEVVPYCQGETVELVAASRAEAADPDLERLRAATTLEEMFEIANSIPNDPDDDYDLMEALNENRKFSGGSPLFPDSPDRGTP